MDPNKLPAHETMADRPGRAGTPSDVVDNLSDAWSDSSQGLIAQSTLKRVCLDDDLELDPSVEETLGHMRFRGVKENTARAIASDLRYIAGWHFTAYAKALPMPTPASVVQTFIAHHLWDPAIKQTNPAHGMPDWIADGMEQLGLKRRPAPGEQRRPASPSTVKRRLASLSTWHRWHRDLRAANPLDDPDVKAALADSARGAATIRNETAASVGSRRGKKSEIAIVADHITAMVAACEAALEVPGTDDSDTRAELTSDQLRALRDRALLLYGWASGGRRRSEIANLRMDQLQPVEGGYLVSLGITKTRDASASEREDKLVPLMGWAAQALDAWCQAARINQGRVFRSLGQSGRVSGKISDKTVNRVVKRRAVEAGVVDADSADRISAHGLRAGFLTEAARQNITMIDAMQMSDHASERSVVGYWQAQQVLRNPAGGLLDRARDPAAGARSSNP
ncbi:hypothetical protein CKO28_09020 [Rhodovibrio sodomensis]|uniref:Tyr recombinase domain-containing protein n=2 Tax=Rhodovibrio sodomensis TaxID=1088 RepID=A0ABS1DDI3_9PROT|nr:hypothetical protein [Rhodovibrio sodomensis]